MIRAEHRPPARHRIPGQPSLGRGRQGGAGGGKGGGLNVRKARVPFRICEARGGGADLVAEGLVPIRRRCCVESVGDDAFRNLLRAHVAKRAERLRPFDRVALERTRGRQAVDHVRDNLAVGESRGIRNEGTDLALARRELPIAIHRRRHRRRDSRGFCRFSRRIRRSRGLGCFTRHHRHSRRASRCDGRRDSRRDRGRDSRS
jgi:hypothetical protein